MKRALVGGNTVCIPSIRAKFHKLHFPTLPTTVFGRLRTLFTQVEKGHLCNV